MTRKRRRMIIVASCFTGIATATSLTLSAFNDNLVFFVSPSDLLKVTPNGRQMRLGGLVQAGTVERGSSAAAGASFRVTDGTASVPVIYKGILPDLFREGQGVVVLGVEQPDGVFRALEVLAKHDETYMPKEIAEALKKSGRWNPANGAPPPTSTWIDPGQGPQPPG